MNDVSVKERLKNLRNETGKTFDELLILYGIERLLYRISVSKYSYNFIVNPTPACFAEAGASVFVNGKPTNEQTMV